MRFFGYEVAFEASWFVLLVSTPEPNVTWPSCTRNPSSPPEPRALDGNGAFLTFQVADAAAEYERVTAAGLHCNLTLKDEPWGQRRFGVIDPAGMWLDVVEQTQPQDGWWGRYLRQ